jgi:hypothetical protein
MPAVVEHDELQASTYPELTGILRMSRELFRGTISVETMSDPDVPSESWTVLNVESVGTPNEIIKTQCEWHERLARQFPDAVSAVKLSICPIA